jgi:hypothetical protein
LPRAGAETMIRGMAAWLQRTGAALAIVVAALAAAGVVGAKGGTVHLRGTAYEFNNTKVLLGGATIRVAEDPRLRATTRRDGTYDLAVPDRAAVTPYIVAAGHHTIYLQTFRTDGEDLDRVNFQMPTDGVYRALAALLAVPLDANGEPRDCAIVSTFSTRNVRDLSFRGFTAYGAHGVPGATASGTPALPPATYFNEQVVPDPAQQRSSVDGGVVWTRVPAGTYTIRAQHPSTHFASFVATCAPGRIVNANPPWGLHELGKAQPATVSARWAGVRLRALRVAKLPPASVVRLRCTGRGCPFRARRVVAKRRGHRSLDLLAALGAPAQRLRPGQTLEVLVSTHAYDGKLVRWRLRSALAPRAVTWCVPLGSTRPRRHC